MTGFIFRRLLATIPVIGIVALFVFFMLRMTPGDPAAILAGDESTPQQVEKIREQLGLNKSLPEQLAIWVGKLLQGDFGVSFYYKKRVTEIILARMGPTLSLATVTLIITILIAVPLGVIAAYWHGGWIDRLVMGFAVLGFSVPVFVTGYLMIYIFSIELKLFPVQGYRSITDGFWPFLHHLILPGLTVSVIYIALIARMTRASMLEVLDEDYIRTARSKGLKEKWVMLRHALRNAAVPIVTVIGVGVGLMIGGVVVTETVYNIPGLGSLTVDAVLGRDYPTIQAVIMLFSLVYVFINLAVDLVYFLLDPRIRY